MDDFNRLLHDQQLALLRIQFLGRVTLRTDVCAMAERIRTHRYPYRSGRAVKVVLGAPGRAA